MLKIMRDKWNKNEKVLREELKSRTDLNQAEYKDIVKLTFEKIFNSDIEDDVFGNKFDISRVTEIDDGDCQGTLMYLIPFDTYQPNEYNYLMTFVSYGSCSGCDTLQSIQDWCSEKLSDTQVEDYLKLCRDILCNTIKPYNYGWRQKDGYEIIEENLY